MMRKFISLLILIPLFGIHGRDLPGWVTSYGVDVPFDREEIFTGFGMHGISDNRASDLENAKVMAMADLARGIKVKITSEVTDKYTEIDGTDSTYYSSIVKSKTDFFLQGVKYLVEEDGNHLYAIAYIEKNTLINDLSGKAENYLLQLSSLTAVEGTNTEEGRNIDELIQSLPLFSSLYETLSILDVFSEHGADNLFSRRARLASLSEVNRLERTIHRRIEQAEKAELENLNDVIMRIALTFKKQGVTKGNLKVTPLTFRHTDFSSPFGYYISKMIESQLQTSLEASGEEILVQGSYWENRGSLELIITARSLTKKETIGNGYVILPMSYIPDNYSLEPQNAEQALTDLYLFQEGALSDGIINLDVWTNKGHSEETLVFQEGEKMELFFRVNQPCFLQIAYILASGQKVLLDENYYLGTDQINRIVKYPVKFQIVPPFGVERFIISASTEGFGLPPVLPQTIDGETYLTFTDIKDIVSGARGLKRDTDNREVRVGETQLSITTIPK